MNWFSSMLSISLVRPTDITITSWEKCYWPEELYPVDFHQKQGTADIKGREFSVQFLSSFWRYRLHFPKDRLSHRALNKGEQTCMNVLLELTLCWWVDASLGTWRFLLSGHFHRSKTSMYNPYIHHHYCVLPHFKEIQWSWLIYLSQGWHCNTVNILNLSVLCFLLWF